MPASSKTNFQQAILLDTDLRGVNLTKAAGVSSEQLRVALTDETTQPPWELVVPEEEWWDEVLEPRVVSPQMVA